MFGYVKRAVELELAGLEPLEQEVQRHDLGERGRMAQLVRIDRMKGGPGIGIDDNFRIGRAAAMRVLSRLRMRVRLRVRVVGLSAMFGVCVPRISLIGGGGRDGESAEEANGNAAPSAQSRKYVRQLCLPIPRVRGASPTRAALSLARGPQAQTIDTSRADESLVAAKTGGTMAHSGYAFQVAKPLSRDSEFVI